MRARLRWPLLMVLCLATCELAGAADSEIHGQVVAVRSCDHVAVRTKAKKILAFRVAGIECPQGKRRFASEAKAFASGLLNGQMITAKPLGTDRQRRIWADIFLPDGRSLSYEMIKAGWARMSAGLINERLSELEESARLAQRGMWREKPRE